MVRKEKHASPYEGTENKTKFAAPLEISSGYIKRVEDGRTVPSQKVLDSICNSYNVNPLYFQGKLSQLSGITEGQLSCIENRGFALT